VGFLGLSQLEEIAMRPDIGICVWSKTDRPQVNSFGLAHMEMPV
jgi:hypothetical protein